VPCFPPEHGEGENEWKTRFWQGPDKRQPVVDMTDARGYDDVKKYPKKGMI
jgi:hypothetical protein